MNRAQFRIAAIGCWVAALATIIAADSYGRGWLHWLGSGEWSEDGVGGLWAITFATLGAIAWAGGRRAK